MTDDPKREDELRQRFWGELKDSPFMMVGLQGVDDDFTRPMTAQIDDERIFFFAARSEDLFKGLGRSNRAIATFAGKGHKFFASIRGTLTEDMDRALIEKLWNPIIASWYRDGKDDPDLVLLRLETDRVDVWEAHTGSTLKAAFIKMLGRDPGKEHQEENRAELAL